MKWQLLFDSIVFGAFVGFLVDVWLARATVKDPKRLFVALAVGIIVGCFVWFGHLAVF